MRSTARGFSSHPSYHRYPHQQSPHPQFNFIIELSGQSSGEISGECSDQVEGLLKKCKLGQEKFYLNPKRGVAARIFFRQWVDALGAMVKLWDLLFDGGHAFVPRLESKKMMPSDCMELRREIGALFVKEVEKVRGCDAVLECRKKMEIVRKDLEVVIRRLGMKKAAGEARNLINKKGLLVKERELIKARLDEFDGALDCLCGYAKGTKESCGGDGVDVFSLERQPDWGRVHSLMLRECRRLRDGLPIYGFRRKIIRHIHHNQVTILIGETGSGKSTQLVQFLDDSGIVSHGSVVCTQPRKIAALSLTRRVTDEINGCYRDAFVICRPTYSSEELSTSKVIYTTDHVLLQYYINNQTLPDISCILIDEAHERSLNTDLLLASIKNLLSSNPSLRLVIMSATADSHRLSEYFSGSSIFYVSGRTFPIDIIYRPPSERRLFSARVAYYVSDVLSMVAEIHQTQGDGTVLAFLTSQAEVEYACNTFSSPSVVSLPLHGKLLHEEQIRVFQDYPGKRKVIFSTNIAETSLTIPGVRYVVDPGMVKDSRFEPGSGMNILRVFWTSRSSAEQRAGRAGRTDTGKCYRLYSREEYEAMPAYQEPEIRRVHLGIAILRVLALGVGNIREFDFVDAPSLDSVELAVRNLVQLGAICTKSSGGLSLTADGRSMVKMGIEPRLGKLVLLCRQSYLILEGVVLASVMVNSRSIFCRIGSDEEKLKADRHKVQFCHRDGDLFTLLSVYRKWDSLPPEDQNRWCWDNSINAKTMRRCRETVLELERCLRHEVSIIVPTYWRWDPESPSDHDSQLKTAILASLSQNIAMYSGSGRLGYEVMGSGAHVHLHPSCSLLSFAERPGWVVFGDILSSPTQYLTCVTAVDPDDFGKLSPPPAFDFAEMGQRRLHVAEISGLGSVLLKKICGRGGSNLAALVSRMREICFDERINLDVRVENGTASLYSSVGANVEAGRYLNGIIETERRWLHNECMHMNLYSAGQGVVPPVALLGAGAVIRHLELEGQSLIVQVSYVGDESFRERDLLIFLEESTGGEVCLLARIVGPVQDGEKVKSVRVTFLTPEAAQAAVDLDGSEFHGSTLQVTVFAAGSERRDPGFTAVSARVYWPRRRSNGFAIVRCHPDDVGVLVEDICSCFRYLRCEPSNRSVDCLVMSGLDKDLSEDEIVNSLRSVVRRTILDFHLVRSDPVEGPPLKVCEEEIMKHICPFLGGNGLAKSCCSVEVFRPEPKGSFVRGVVKFDERLHLEAAKALEHIEGKTLPGCESWQTIKCQRVFNSFLSCPAQAYPVIKVQLDALLVRSRRRNDVECSLSRNLNGSYRVKLSANATKTVAELRHPFEELMKGKPVTDSRLTPTLLQSLFSRDGLPITKEIERATDTFIFSDRHNLQVQIFGLPHNIKKAESQLILSLLYINESRELEIQLRGPGLPSDLMKQVVNTFGPDLHLLKSRFPTVTFSLNTRLHSILLHGDRRVKPLVEKAILQAAKKPCDTESCPICLCDLESPHRLEGCTHVSCGSCLVDQCESAIRNKDGFPLRCSHTGCRSPILISDLRALLPGERIEDLFQASLCNYVASSRGGVRFCPTPDCPAVYRTGEGRAPFRCGACGVETCRGCGVEYHPSVSCERYKMYKEDPDLLLREWCEGKEYVKRCPVCGNMIEKSEGCNHVECRCENHICWSCLEVFGTSEDCYTHLKSVHGSIT